MKEKTRTEYSLLNMATNIFGYGFNTVFGYLCRMVFVRCLAVEYLGISGLFSNILSMLSLAELGIGSAIGYALYKPIADKDEEKIASLMVFYGKAYRIIGILVGLTGLLILPLLPLVIQEAPNIPENLYVIYLVFLFNAEFSYFYSYKGTLLFAMQRNYVVQQIYYGTMGLQYLLQIILLLTTHNYMLYLAAQTLCVVCNNLLVSRKVDKDYPFLQTAADRPLEKEEKKNLFINVKALTVNRLCSALVNNTDNVAITYFQGLITTGVASNYTLLIATLGTMIGQIFSSITASIGNLNAAEDESRRYQFFQTYHLANFWIYGWGTIGIALTTTDIVALCFGQQYTLQPAIPLILALNFYLVGMNNAVYAYKSTMGLFRYGQYLLLFTAAINLALDILLGREMGLLGIYLATFIARIVTNVWFEPWVVFKYGFRKNSFRYFVGYLGFAGLLAAIYFLCLWLCSLCRFGLALNLLVKLIICSAVPNGICWLVFHRTPEYAYLEQSVKRVLVRLVAKIQRSI